MPAGNIGNRHPGLGCLRHRSQLLLQRVSPAPLDSCEDFNSIDCVRHRRMTRLTPSPSLCSYGPVEMGAAPVRDSVATLIAAVFWASSWSTKAPTPKAAE